MQTTLDIHTTPAEFEGWVNAYGMAKQGPRYLPDHGFGFVEPPYDRKALLHRAPDGYIYFFIDALDIDNDRLRVTAEPRNGLNPPSPALLGYFDAMVAAVKQRWPNPTEARASRESGPERGMKIGTAERVREMHRLLKSGMSQREAKGLARCDPSTYYRRCREVTGEEPIPPYT